MKTIQQVYLILLFLGISNLVIAQLPTSEFFYGETSTLDVFEDIKPTSDGGYITAGLSHEAGKGGQFYIVKFAADGTEEFSKKVGDTGTEIAYSIVVLSDRYVIGGSILKLGDRTRDGYLVSVDFEGNVLEELTFGGNGEDFVVDMTVLANGQIAIASTYEYGMENGADLNIRIYDSELNLLGETSYGTTEKEAPLFIGETTPNGDILVSGNTNNSEALVLSFSADLSTLNWVSNWNYDDFNFYYVNAGIPINEETYAFVAMDYSNVPSLFFVETATGISQNSLPIPTTMNGSSPWDIVKIANTAYILLNFNERIILPFDILTNDFGTPIPTFERATNIAVSSEGKLGLAGLEETPSYSVAKISQQDTNDTLVEWSVSVGDFTSQQVLAGSSLVEAENGQMYLGSNVTEGNGNQNIQIMKIAGDGSVIWGTTIGDTALLNRCYGVATAENGGCVALYSTFVGQGENTLTLQKISADGDLEWAQILNSDEPFKSSSTSQIVASSDGGYYVGSTVKTESFDDFIFLAKIGGLGEMLWQEMYQIDEEDTYFGNLIEAANGDILVGGYRTITSRAKAVLLRIDAAGTLIWGSNYGVTESTFDDYARFTGIAEAADGTIFATGIKLRNGGLFQGKGHLMKIAANGETLSGGWMEANDFGTNMSSVVINESGRIFTLNLLVNHDYFDNAFLSSIRIHSIEIQEYNEDLEEINNQIFGEGYGPNMSRMIPHSNGGMVAYGSATVENNTSGYLLYIDSMGVSATIEIVRSGTLKLLPTISNGNFSINFKSQHTGDLSLKIYNTNGQIVHEMTDKKANENWQKDLNLPELAAGNYFVNIRLGEYAWTQQMVKQ